MHPAQDPLQSTLIFFITFCSNVSSVGTVVIKTGFKNWNEERLEVQLEVDSSENHISVHSSEHWWWRTVAKIKRPFREHHNLTHLRHISRRILREWEIELPRDSRVGDIFIIVVVSRTVNVTTYLLTYLKTWSALIKINNTRDKHGWLCHHVWCNDEATVVDEQVMIIRFAVSTCTNVSNSRTDRVAINTALFYTNLFNLIQSNVHCS